MAKTTQKTPKKTPLYIKNPDRVLVVKFDSRIFVIPEPDLVPYDKTGLVVSMAATDLDAFFESHDTPKVVAAVVDNLHIMDGGPGG